VRGGGLCVLSAAPQAGTLHTALHSGSARFSMLIACRDMREC